jgi:hypothetical protein
VDYGDTSFFLVILGKAVGVLRIGGSEVAAEA